MPGLVNDELRQIVGIVDKVHGDGDLPTIEVSAVPDLTSPRGRPIDGVFIYEQGADGRILPRSIRLRLGAPHLAFVALHELGHFLDGCALPGMGFSSEADASLASWRRALVLSRAWRELNRLASDVEPSTSLRAASLLRPDELWARSYAQFVAVRSRNLMLRQALGALRRATAGDVYFPRQWAEDDFIDLEAAIDDLFRSLGWIV